MPPKTKCEPLSHDWEYKWDGVIRKCRKCKTTHYYHYCAAQWEWSANISYQNMGMKTRGLFDSDFYVSTEDQSGKPTASDL